MIRKELANECRSDHRGRDGAKISLSALHVCPLLLPWEINKSPLGRVKIFTTRLVCKNCGYTNFHRRSSNLAVSWDLDTLETRFCMFRGNIRVLHLHASNVQFTWSLRVLQARFSSFFYNIVRGQSGFPIPMENHLPIDRRVIMCAGRKIFRVSKCNNIQKDNYYKLRSKERACYYYHHFHIGSTKRHSRSFKSQVFLSLNASARISRIILAIVENPRIKDTPVLGNNCASNV